MMVSPKMCQPARMNSTTRQDSLALSVVVPCYNEQEGIGELHHRVSMACRSNIGNDYEILFVDDGSRDDTWQKIIALSKTDSHVVAVRLTRNYGHQLALTAGLDICRGDRIFIIDADLQDPPELLGPMLKLMDDGAHVVYGRRIKRRGDSAFKRLSATAFYRTLGKLIDIEIPLDTGDFRLISRKTLEMLRRMPEQHRFVRGMVAWIGLKQVPIDYVRHERYAGTTKYPLKKMIGLALDAITGFSTRPLRVASHLGLTFAILAGIGIVYTVYSWLFFRTITGWTSVMTVVLALGSIQLLVLWVFGEYLGRVLAEVKRRPLFLIDEIVGPSTVRDNRNCTASPTVNAGAKTSD